MLCSVHNTVLCYLNRLIYSVLDDLDLKKKTLLGEEVFFKYEPLIVEMNNPDGAQVVHSTHCTAQSLLPHFS